MKLIVPKTVEKSFKETVHRTVIRDAYRWLEDVESKKVSRWIDNQNKFSEPLLRKAPMRTKVAKRLSQLLRIDTISVPYPKNGFYFTMKRKANQDLAVLYVQKGLQGKKRALIDQNKFSKDKTAVLTRWSVSPKAKYVAYAVSKHANDQNSIHVIEVKTGKKLPDIIPEEVYPAMHSGNVWNPDESGFWYTKRYKYAPKGELKLYQKIYYHKLGDSVGDDQLVFGKKLTKDALPSVKVSSDGKYLIAEIHIASWNISRGDLYIKDITKKSDFLPIVKGVEALFSAWIHRDRIYITTNHKSPKWKIVMVSTKDATKGIRYWKTIIPESNHVVNYAKTVSDRLFVETQENVHSVLREYTLDGKFISKLKLPTFGTTTNINAENEGEEIFFGFTSFLVPFQIYHLDLKTNQMKLLDELKNDINFKKYTVEQKWYKSKDGTKIPMFLIHKKGIKLNGKNPTLLYGYGGFNHSIMPSFQSTRAVFIEMGGVYAIANIRGGGEFGETWHKAGVKNKKQNVFNDFIAAAEWLIKNKYTDSNHLAAFGWSNGGLLMSAMITQKPDLFKTLVVGAPVIDMLRFHKFFGGRHWMADYGNPDDPKMFRYLLKYSPYHNIKDGISYPATLILTAEGDDRVHPMHAYKFTARLQKANTSFNPILLRVERKAGHGGAASISKIIHQYADIYGFIFWQLGFKPQ